MQKLILTLRWQFAVLLAVLGMFVTLAVVTNVSTHVQPEDVVAIKTILDVPQKPEVHSFDDEIRVIRWAQARVFKVAPDMVPIAEYSDREPMDLHLIGLIF